MIEAEEAFIGLVEEALRANDSRVALDRLASECLEGYQRDYVRGCALRVEAAQAGDTAPDKASCYFLSSQSFLDAYRKAPEHIAQLCLAKFLESMAFVTVVRAGAVIDVTVRHCLYTASSQLFDQAVNLLPHSYQNNRAFWLGWKLLCDGKASILRSDGQRDLEAKARDQEVAARCFRESAQAFEAGGQIPLAVISDGWRVYSEAWSLAFRGQIEKALAKFDQAIELFITAGRQDIASGCLEQIQPLRP